VEAWGIDLFRDAFALRFEQLTGLRPLFGEPAMPDEPAVASTAAVLPQRQAGRFRVRVGVELGELTPDQLRLLAALAVQEGDGRVRFSPEQNAEIAWVAEERIARVLAELSSGGLATFGTGDISDVRACPGTTHCVLAVSDSQGVAGDVGERFRAAPPSDESVKRMRVHVSGCPNSCAQHQASDIGLAGCRVKTGGEIREGYQLFVGGRLGRRVRMADRIGRLVADQVTDAIDALVDFHLEHRQDSEEFPDVVERLGPDAVAAFVTSRLGDAFLPSRSDDMEVAS
jgi:sulfite reductase beta subunit-like hemoprotein